MRMPVIVGVLALVVLSASSYSSSALRAEATQAPTFSTFARVYKSGTPGLADPTPIRKLSPPYTPQAMRAKVQGFVELEITVDADGRVRDAMVTKSLDSQYGMDDEAVKAAAQWTFVPGRLKDTAVPVRTTVTFELALH